MNCVFELNVSLVKHDENDTSKSTSKTNEMLFISFLLLTTNVTSDYAQEFNFINQN